MKKADLDLCTDYLLSTFGAATATGLSAMVGEVLSRCRLMNVVWAVTKDLLPTSFMHWQDKSVPSEELVFVRLQNMFINR
jgi:hypothetical protein